MEDILSQTPRRGSHDDRVAGQHLLHILPEFHQPGRDDCFLNAEQTSKLSGITVIVLPVCLLQRRNKAIGGDQHHLAVYLPDLGDRLKKPLAIMWLSRNPHLGYSTADEIFFAFPTSSPFNLSFHS